MVRVGRGSLSVQCQLTRSNLFISQELPPFEYVEINGLKIPDPGHAYVVLWEALAGMSPDIEYGSDDEGGTGAAGGKSRSVSAKTALKGLEAHFGTGQGRKASQIGGPRRTT